MKFLYSLILIFLISCQSKNSFDIDKFSNVYSEILIIRETEADSALALKRIDSVFSANGLTELEFRKQTMDLVNKNKEFLKVIDSVRSSIRKKVSEESKRELEKK